ncbi:hypothetical protein T02_11731 [Trichinella nativa]|uniref:Uncharacterized protein n=1 Tax=Trichinella nativa TaxID=6335 RepID=A0A0V1LE10_9BILA|nr:hypothetical protein T02_11731 [Trichinella nativa]
MQLCQPSRWLLVHIAAPCTFQSGILTDATPAVNTRTRLQIDLTSQHLRFRNLWMQSSPAKMLIQAGRPAEA